MIKKYSEEKRMEVINARKAGATVCSLSGSVYAISACHSQGKINIQKNPVIKDWIAENKKMVGVVLIVRKISLKLKRLRVNRKWSSLR